MTNSAETPEYIAKTGRDAKDRLTIQHRVFAPGTELLLEMSNFRSDMRTLIIGCGCGDETVMIATKLSAEGHVVALDKSPKQIEQTRQAVEKAGISEKVSYLTKSIEELADTDGEYDLIVCRFVIPHLADPKRAVAILKDRLRPGGVLASQEPIVSSCRAEPHSPALERYIGLMLAFAARNKLDFDMAKTIPSLFASSGLETSDKTWQPVVSGADKSMVTLSAQECMPAILKQVLITPEEAKALIVAIDEEVVKPKNVILFQCINILTVGIKSINLET